MDWFLTPKIEHFFVFGMGTYIANDFKENNRKFLLTCAQWWKLNKKKKWNFLFSSILQRKVAEIFSPGSISQNLTKWQNITSFFCGRVGEDFLVVLRTFQHLLARVIFLFSFLLFKLMLSTYKVCKSLKIEFYWIIRVIWLKVGDWKWRLEL